jgi:hypothetical protein
MMDYQMPGPAIRIMLQRIMVQKGIEDSILEAANVGLAGTIFAGLLPICKHSAKFPVF